VAVTGRGLTPSPAFPSPLSTVRSFLVNGATTGLSRRARTSERANAFCLGHRSGMPTDLV